MSKKRVAIPGSERTPVPDARLVGPADPQERIEVTVMLKPISTLPSLDKTVKPQERTHLSRAGVRRQVWRGSQGLRPH